MVKKIFKIFSILTSLLFFPFAAYAQGYVLLSEFGTDPHTPVTNPDAFLSSLFAVFLSVAVILAVIRLMICGVQYMTSESISSKGAAKTCIQYVIGGLLLILTSVVLLQTINPDFISVSFSTIESAISP